MEGEEPKRCRDPCYGASDALGVAYETRYRIHIGGTKYIYIYVCRNMIYLDMAWHGMT